MKKDITAIILAGGEGSRFENNDKGLIQWRGKPLVEHVIDRILPQVSKIIISCNRNQSYYSSLGHPICEDSLAGYQGPLAGIQSALALVKTPLALVCPCDTPLIPNQLAEKLYSSLSGDQLELCYADDGERHQYLMALMKADVLVSLNKYLEAGNRSVKGWIKELNHCSAGFSEQSHTFSNVNTVSDLDQLI
jgi:molybdopterin-guanine dinucleotide biosynthesis protein A